LTLIFVKTPADYKTAATISLKKSLKTVCGSKQIWLCVIAATTSFGILLSYASFWYTQVQKFYAVDTTDALIISGLIFAGVGIGTPLLGWISNIVKSLIMIIHGSLVLGTMFLLLGIYLPHFNIDSYIIIKIVSFFIGFFLSGAMLFYTVVSEISSDSTRGVALSVTNTGVFLFNSLMMFIPYLFITQQSTSFFTYLWILPFFVLLSILLTYFVKESYPT
jgi:MFS family permease